MCLVVWSSCNQDVSLATICACRAACRSQTTSRPTTTVFGNSFSRINFFPFLFCRTERTRFCWCGLRVERHADQKKQVAILVPCGMVPLQPGYQSCNELLLSCCALIAKDKSPSNNSLEEFFFDKLFFPSAKNKI